MHQPESPTFLAPEFHRHVASRLRKSFFRAIIFLSLCICPTACGPSADQKEEELSTIEKCEAVCEKLQACCPFVCLIACDCEDWLTDVEAAGCEEEYTDYLDCELADDACFGESAGGAGSEIKVPCASESEDYYLCLGIDSGS